MPNQGNLENRGNQEKRKNSTTWFSLVLGVGLLVGSAGLASSLAGDGRPNPAAERQWLSIGQVHEKLEAAGFRNVEKIEREQGVYEARATDRNGARVKLYINPQTGEVTDRSGRGEHRRRDRDGSSGDARPRENGDSRLRESGDSRPRESGAAAPYPVECNKRRCRDDLTQNPAAAQPAAK